VLYFKKRQPILNIILSLLYYIINPPQMVKTMLFKPYWRRRYNL